MTENFDLLKQALQKRLRVRAMYQGKVRHFCPHLLGWKGEIAFCWGYQFGGESSRGPVVPGSWQNWRCFRVETLSNIELSEGRWHTAPNRLRPQHCIDIIEADVGKIPLD